MYTVYCHTFPNNKKYFGVTAQKPECRWGKNGNGYKKSEYLYNAIQKYGWQNIKHEIIDDNLTMEEASRLEIELIRKYKTSVKEYGYNISKGGVKNFGIVSESTKGKLRSANIGKKVSDKTKEKISKSLKGKIVSEKSKKRMSEAQKKSFANGNNAMHSKEAREKARMKLKGKFPAVALQKATVAKHHPVINLSTGEKYISIKEACEKTGLNRSTIIRNCNGCVKKSKWKYIEKP